MYNQIYEQHMMGIEALETIEKEQWKLYKAETNLLLKAATLERIQGLQYLISSAHNYI